MFVSSTKTNCCECLMHESKCCFTHTLHPYCAVAWFTHRQTCFQSRSSTAESKMVTSTRLLCRSSCFINQKKTQKRPVMYHRASPYLFWCLCFFTRSLNESVCWLLVNQHPLHRIPSSLQLRWPPALLSASLLVFSSLYISTHPWLCFLSFF